MLLIFGGGSVFKKASKFPSCKAISPRSGVKITLQYIMKAGTGGASSQSSL